MIKFNELFRNTLKRNLFENRFFLKEKSVDLVKKSIGNYKKNILSNIACNENVFSINSHVAIFNINEVFDNIKNFTFQLRSDNWNVFRENEIKVEISNRYKFVLHSQEEMQLRVDRENFEYECENEFWFDKNNIEDYDKISSFKCFIDFEFNLEDRKKIEKNGNYFNYDGWCNYILKILIISFPDFKFEKSNNVYRFTKTLVNGLEFGFEYNNLNLKNGIKKGILHLPDYFNIIVFNHSFDKKTKQQDYIFKYNEDVLSMGILGNPLFYHPAIPLKSFSTIELYHYGKFYPNNIEPKNVRQYEPIENRKISLIHCNKYGEKLKKHCFFYLNLLAYSTKDYLDYLELSLTKEVLSSSKK